MSHTTARHADRLRFALHLSQFICQRYHSHILLPCSAITDPTYCLRVQNGNLSIEVPNHIHLFINLVYFSHCRALGEENGTGVLPKRAWWQTNPKKETKKKKHTHKQPTTMIWSFQQVLSVKPEPDIAYSSVPRASIVVQKPLKTHYWATPLHRVTCSFITANAHTVVYFEWIPHTPSCCHKYSPEHKMCINQLLKIVPDKSTT